MKVSKIFLLLFLIACCFESHAGLRTRWVCEECRASAIGLTTSKTQQQFSIDLLNTKNSSSTTQNSVQNTNTAIIIDETDFNTISAVGNSWLDFSTSSKTFSMNIGSANNSSAQTWTLPANFMTNFSGFVRVDFVLPSTLPAPLQIAGADRVMKGYSLDDEGNPLTEYDHFDISNTQIVHLGTSYDSESSADVAYNEADYEYADVPLEIGDNWTAIEEEEDYETGLTLTKTEQENTVDAYGIITTPDGTFNCLRMTSTIKNYTRPNESSSFTLQSTTYGVSFITKEGYYFYAQKPSVATSGTVSLSNFGYRKIVNTANLGETSEVKLNNDSKGVTINSDNTLAHPSSILEISSADKGVLIPRIAKANRPLSPAEGLLVYQIDDTPGFYYFDGTAWQRLNNTVSSMMSANARAFDYAQAASKQETGNANIKNDFNGTVDSVVERNRDQNRSHVQGTGNLENGSTFIKFDQPRDDFDNLLINIQLEGDCNGLYISKKSREGFEVRELQKGKSNVKFSWRID
jgi:hypothetical protein